MTTESVSAFANCGDGSLAPSKAVAQLRDRAPCRRVDGGPDCDELMKLA